MTAFAWRTCGRRRRWHRFLNPAHLLALHQLIEPFPLRWREFLTQPLGDIRQLLAHLRSNLFQNPAGSFLAFTHKLFDALPLRGGQIQFPRGSQEKLDAPLFNTAL